jgi:hypothetical protein
VLPRTRSIVSRDRGSAVLLALASASEALRRIILQQTTRENPQTSERDPKARCPPPTILITMEQRKQADLKATLAKHDSSAHENSPLHLLDLPLSVLEKILAYAVRGPALNG